MGRKAIYIPDDLAVDMDSIRRCDWPGDDKLMIEYHDNEWGKPLHDDNKLFEAVILDTFQAGLSWKTILNKRENFRKAFDNFNAEKMAEYGEKDIARLMQDAGIIRNRMKIIAAIENARKFQDIRKEFGSFDNYIWQFTGHKTIKNKFNSVKGLPTKSNESDEMSRDMKKRGFKFVGCTICYAFMQGAGMVNDHITSCFRYEERP